MLEIFSTFDPVLVGAYIVTLSAMNFTPGPAVLKVVSDSISNGVGPAHASMLGILSANFMYALLAVAGMGALIITFPIVFEIIKWVGVGYLLFLAFKIITQRVSTVKKSDLRVERSSLKKLFWTSFATQGANPKSVLSFCVMLPIFAGAGEGIEIRMLLLALLNMVLEYPALLFYSLIGSVASKFAISSISRKLLNLVSGFGLGIAAIMVARTSIQQR